jgi:hypothetical protein
MNIFVTSPVIAVSAIVLDDVRLNKMILETAQMCATALREGWGINTTYKTSHKNHPCNVWARKCPANLNWLIEYGLALYDEKIFRSGKDHKSGKELQLLKSIFSEKFPDMSSAMTVSPFANCARRKDMNLDFTHLPVHEAYKHYLNARWDLSVKTPAKWTNRDVPEWRISDEWKKVNNYA